MPFLLRKACLFSLHEKLAAESKDGYNEEHFNEEVGEPV